MKSLAQHIPWLSVFIGGCLAGAGLLSLSSGPAPVQQPVQLVNPAVVTHLLEAPAPKGDQETQPKSAKEDSTPVPDVVPPLDAASLTLSDSAEADDASGFRSAADVLARLEAAYQEQRARSRAVEASIAADSVPEPAATEPAAEPPAAEAMAVSGSPPSSEAPVASVGEQPDGSWEPEGQQEPQPSSMQHASAQRTEVHGDVHQGDQIREGDVNQVQQLSVLNVQQVVVLPPDARAPRREPRPTGQVPGGVGASVAPSSVDPWARAKLSPRHNPWTTSRMSPRHDPWRGLRTAPNNPWGPVFGRRP